jgi:hypothetical protein|uniref:Protein kinase domain-containing protein n=1 Tax=viral metagenome TaxID=1070528 RepID=A0A6C0H495_9ZZZZ
MELNYRKNNNKQLFETISNTEFLDITNIQNYFPLYNNYFDLNSNNYNAINLNNSYKLETIVEKINYNKFVATICDVCNNNCSKHIFIKFSPLIDPVKYMLGKYDNDYNISELPKLYSSDHVNNSIEYYTKYKKILDPNNSAYIDGFFSFLSSCLLNNYSFYNGLNYYGAFLGIKNNFKVNISEDLEFLNESEHFHKYRDNLFKIEGNEKIRNIFCKSNKYKKALLITANTEDLPIDDLTIDDLTIDDLTIEDLNISKQHSLENKTIIQELELTYENVELLDKASTKSSNHNTSKNESTNSSSCSSRSSNTESLDSNKTESDELSSQDSYGDEEIFCSIDKFPVEIIVLECCHDTLDSYISSKKIKDDEWESIVLQILFTLITYQKVFWFTHNDLHTNNIVYVETEKKYLYYKFNNSHYKVPTFGKIYKIIDFGRAIYRFKNKFMCSDSYSHDGDAATQYNCEPYLNENKPRLDPNYSFDLCRLGCSLFDYFIDDLEDIKKLKSPIKKIMIEWVYDDKNKNILYKNDGTERYPDFKLYKMIARNVHKHTPQNVLKKLLFEKYVIAKKKINNPEAIFNIDDLPVMV